MGTWQGAAEGRLSTAVPSSVSTRLPLEHKECPISPIEIRAPLYQHHWADLDPQQGRKECGANGISIVRVLGGKPWRTSSAGSVTAVQGGRGVARPSTADAHTGCRVVADSSVGRAEPKEPLLRNIVLLGLIPRQPRSKTVAELQRELAARGFNVSTRTLQRDLVDKLAAEFPIFCDDAATPYRWSFDRQAQFNLPAVDPAAALAMHLSEGHLQRVLPPGVLVTLAPQFEDARRQLRAVGAGAGLESWARRVRSVPFGPVVAPAAVAPEVWEAVAEAVLQGCQMHLKYLSRTKGSLRSLHLHPLGIASRGAVTYLIGCVDGYDDVRHFALHRIKAAECLRAAARNCDFDIDLYLPTAAFTPRHAEELVTLRAHVHPRVAWSLRELPLGNDQCLAPLDHGEWESLEVSVRDDEDTIRWIRAQGPDIRVVGPKHWRERLAGEAKQLSGAYSESVESID